MSLRCLLLSVCLLLLPARALEPSQVVVVYNADSVLSTKSAQRYALLRRIPANQLVALSDIKGGHISRMDFEEKIRLPLLEIGRQRGWRWPAGYSRGQKRILAMVLMPDLPLGIRATPRPKGTPAPGKLREDHAAVDSELMLLGGNHPVAGAMGNPCYGKQISLGRDLPPVLAVCRIDAPDAASITRMIEDPIRVERDGLRGWTVVDQGGPYKEADNWLAAIARQAQEAGQPLFYETSKATLAEAFPLMTDTAVYFGWYTNPANGPFHPATAGDFHFAPGAVAVHLHSYSASSVKDATRWVGALLTRGAAVTAGNVFEPYLGPSLHFDVFYNRLMKGHCVAEAALMASPSTSWQCIILGDPLYRPFAAATKPGDENACNEWTRLRREWGDDLNALRREIRKRERQLYGASLAEMFAWYCLEHKFMDDAVEFFTTACGCHRELRDRTRALIMVATVLAADGKKERALEVLRPWLASGAESPYLPALQKTHDVIAGVKPKPAPAKK